MLPSLDPDDVRRERKIREQRRELSEQRADFIIRRTKNPPYAPLELIATVHEDLTLKRMQRYFGSQEERETNLFWKNQRRFLEFIDPNNPHQGLGKANPGYNYSHAWFLKKNPEYASQFESLTAKGLQEYRKKNWEMYNNLCTRMHEIAPRYKSLDAVLIPIDKLASTLLFSFPIPSDSET